MIILIWLLIDGFMVLQLLAFPYILVTRRRAKIYLLVEHLAALASKGMPLHTGLQALGLDLGGTLGRGVNLIGQNLEDGLPLSDSLVAQPRILPPIIRSMVMLGEKSGNLAGFMEELRHSYRRIVEQPYQSIYFFFYPIVVSAFVTLAILSMHTFIIPKFEDVFRQIGVDNSYWEWWPVLMGFNKFMVAALVITALFILCGGGSIHFRSEPLHFLRGLLDRVILASPILGGLVRDGSVQRFSLSVGLFLRAGASLHEAVRATAEAEVNEVLRRRYERLAERLAEGGRLSEVARRERLFRDDFLWFVETGEASGALPEHLMQAAAHYDTKTQFAAQLALRAVTPILVLVNGLQVLGVCLLCMLPLRDLMNGVKAW